MNKLFYLVRHGESEGNANGFFQSPSTPLSPKGREQALLVAKRFKRSDFNIQKIISSTMVRARETAEAIAKSIKVPLEYSDLFIERDYVSTSLHGKRRNDEEIQELLSWFRKGEFDPNFRHSDEESINDVIARAKRAVNFLTSQPEDRFCVVTHGSYIAILVAVMMYGEDVTPEDCMSTYWMFTSSNTGITKISYKPDFFESRGIFMARYYNDHSHLEYADQSLFGRIRKWWSTK